MAIPQKQKRDILRTIGGFAAAGILAAGLIFLGNRNDAVSEACLLYTSPSPRD